MFLYIGILGIILFLNSCLLFEYTYYEEYSDVFWLYPSRDGKSYDKVKMFNKEFDKRCKELVLEKGLVKDKTNDWSLECKCDCYIDYSDENQMRINTNKYVGAKVAIGIGNKPIVIPTLILPFITIQKFRKDRKFFLSISFSQYQVSPIKQIDTIILHFYKYSLFDTIILQKDTKCREIKYIDTLYQIVCTDSIIISKKGNKRYCNLNFDKSVEIYHLNYELKNPLIYLPVNKQIDTLLYYGIKIIYKNSDGEKKHLSIDSLGMRLSRDKGFRRVFL